MHRHPMARMIGIIVLGLMMLTGPAQADAAIARAGDGPDAPSPTPSTSQPSPSPTASRALEMLPQIPPELCEVASPLILLYCHAPEIGKVGEQAGQVLRDTATEALEHGVIKPLASLVLEAVKSLVGVFVTMFLSTTSFDLRTQGTLTLYGLTIAIGWLIGAVLLMGQMLRTMVQGKPIPLIQALSGLVVTALVGGAGVGLTALLMEAANTLTKIIFDQMATTGQPASQQNVHEQILTMMSLTPAPAGAAVAGVQVLTHWLLGVLVILALIMQIIVVLLRNASLPLLALLLPIAAAGMIGGGATRQWLPKTITAATAIIVYQPFVALIITAAVRQWSAARDAHGLVYGLVMLVLSLLAMPALMKVFAPLGALAGGGGGGGGGLLRPLMDLAMMTGRYGGGQALGDAADAATDEVQTTSAGQFAQQREAGNATSADAGSAPAAEHTSPPASDPSAGDTALPSRAAAADSPAASDPSPAGLSGISSAEPATAATSSAETSATTAAAAEGSSAATTATAATAAGGPIGALVYGAEQGVQVAEHGMQLAEQHVGAGGDAAAAHPVDRHPASPPDSREGGLRDRT